MCEVTKLNFKQIYPQIKKSLEEAKFLSVDLEFSALQPFSDHAPSLFDNNKQRYAKIRRNLQQVVPLQVGITAFRYDGDSNDYFGDVFSFYVAPPAFGPITKSFYFEASSLTFLSLHKFDFNKFAHLGIPYLNRPQEAELRHLLRTHQLIGENSALHCKFEDMVRYYRPIINKWLTTCNTGDFLEVPTIIEKYEHFYELIYFLHKDFRRCFKNLWTYEKNGHFCVKKVTDEEYSQLLQHCTLDTDILNTLIGFTHVFRLLTSLKKPIIGHNLLQDLMILMHTFETDLPQSYSQFKRLTNEIFPVIFDTKHLYYELRSSIPKEKSANHTGLEALYNYFKDGFGRHLVANCSAIQSNVAAKDLDKYHDAGWDSFCTGYIFIRMAYLNAAQFYPKRRSIVCSDAIARLEPFKNCVNMIRGSTRHIKIDGEDPSSTRPPWLIVESLKNEPVDVGDLTSLLDSYGTVDIRRISAKGNRLLVAVDTFRAAREITNKFTGNSRFQVKPYNFLKHSTAGHACILTAVAISGTLLLWLTHSVLKR